MLKLRSQIISPNKNLKFIINRKIQEIYPDITITLKIMVTIPVTVMSAKKIVFNLLPEINYEQLFGLPLLSTEF